MFNFLSFQVGKVIRILENVSLKIQEHEQKKPGILLTFIAVLIQSVNLDRGSRLGVKEIAF